jgi:beta-ketodecanoyl-[acyl-carrier-protein] synthase
MKDVVISGTGLYRPPHIITNAELVEAFNAYAALQNDKNAQRIAAGDVEPMVGSSVEFIEKASGIRQRYVIDKAGVALSNPSLIANTVAESPRNRPSKPT